MEFRRICGVSPESGALASGTGSVKAVLGGRNRGTCERSRNATSLRTVFG